MNDAQIKQILMSLKEHGADYIYNFPDPEIKKHIDEIAPYVIGYRRYLRHFVCKGLSARGKDLLR